MSRLFKNHTYEIGSDYYSNRFAIGTYRASEYHWHLLVGAIFVFMAVLLACTIPLFLYHSAPFAVVVVQVGMVIMCAYTATMEPVQKAYDLFWRVRKVSKEIKTNAKMWYGKDWRESSVECHEAHIPGDCPLCGAE